MNADYVFQDKLLKLSSSHLMGWGFSCVLKQIIWALQLVRQMSTACSAYDRTRASPVAYRKTGGQGSLFYFFKGALRWLHLRGYKITWEALSVWE